MTAVGAFNFFIGQWFWARLARANNKTWGIVYPVVPLTGWQLPILPKIRFVPRRYKYVALWKNNKHE
jgi:hypothetical protein